MPGPDFRISRRNFRVLNSLAVTLIAVVVLSLPAVLSSPSVAGAAPRDELLTRAREIKTQVDALDKQTELLSEDYNAAREYHREVAEQEKAATERLELTTKHTATMQARLSSRAANMYRTGPLGFLDVLLGASDFEAFAQTWDFLKQLNEDDARMLADLKEAKSEQAKAQTELERRAEEAAAVSRELASRKVSIEGKLAERKRMLSGLEAEVAALDRAEEERLAAEAARAARAARAAPRAEPGGGTFPPPTQAARSEVVSIAKRYLGARYVWGAEGPNTFDCSGFTMFVYRQVGVKLPRVSRDQIRAGERVNRSDLQPGDLVFFGNPIHHVGIYVGGGMMIHSPRTGDVVKISPLHSDYVGACRP